MLYVAVMSIYLDKLAHIQEVINCRYSISQMCTREDGLAYISGAPSIDDVMSYNSLTLIFILFYRFPSNLFPKNGFGVRPGATNLPKSTPRVSTCATIPSPKNQS